MNRLHRRNKRRKIFWTTITVGVIAFFIYQIIMVPVRIDDLTRDKVITTGIITGTSSNQRNTGGGVYFKFYANGKEYEGSTGYPNLSTTFCEDLVGRKFPVIYSSKRIKNNQMLLTKEIFEKYGMKQPDSLRWIEDYLQLR
jgi:hypothetical protein